MLETGKGLKTMTSNIAELFKICDELKTIYEQKIIVIDNKLKELDDKIKTLDDMQKKNNMIVESIVNN